MPLIHPRFVAIDSSILASWSKDNYSEIKKTRDNARKSLELLLRGIQLNTVTTFAMRVKAWCLHSSGK
jgi:hypothetical protein